MKAGHKDHQIVVSYSQDFESYSELDEKKLVGYKRRRFYQDLFGGCAENTLKKSKVEIRLFNKLLQ